MVQLNELTQAIEIIKNKKNILVVAHERPDGDALGSTLGLVHVLRQNGQMADAYMPQPLPNKFKTMVVDNYLTAMTLEEINTNYDLVVVLDSATSSRIALGDDIKYDLLTTPTLNIDHHAGNSVEATWSYVDGDAAAASLLIYKLLKLAKMPISSTAATLLLIGIITDTGAFRFTNSSAEAIHAAGDLRECGGDWGAIMEAVFFSKPLNQQKFETELLHNHVELNCDGRFYCGVIPKELFDKYNFNMRDGESVIDLLREISGVVIAALVYAQGATFKCSLRSKDSRYSASGIAAHFGGGGHLMAAGCTIEANSIEEAKELLLQVVTEILNR